MAQDEPAADTPPGPASYGAVRHPYGEGTASGDAGWRAEVQRRMDELKKNDTAWPPPKGEPPRVSAGATIGAWTIAGLLTGPVIGAACGVLVTLFLYASSNILSTPNLTVSSSGGPGLATGVLGAVLLGAFLGAIPGLALGFFLGLLIGCYLAWARPPAAEVPGRIVILIITALLAPAMVLTMLTGGFGFIFLIFPALVALGVAPCLSRRLPPLS